MKVFVSYRRRDSGYIAEPIRAAIDEHFGDGSAFLDKVHIGFGADYRQELEHAVRSADCMVVLIGPNWQVERLAEDDDPVRFELSLAKAQGLAIIPVLHTDEKMPDRRKFPELLRWFADINAAEFLSPQHFRTEVQDLLDLIARRVAQERARPKEAANGSGTSFVTNAPAAEGPGRRVIDDRYELQQRIGRGSMSDVFLASDLKLDRPVAVKVLFPELAVDPNFVERFRREAQAAANLNHPNIVGVYDWGRYENTYFMAMEYVQGRTLADILRANRSVTSQQAAEIAIEMAGALSFAHRGDVMHGHLTTTNVLIGSNGAVKVSDFDSFSHAISLVGAATYFSPEQAQGAQPDPRSDLYSLGVVLYEMVGGRPPFTGENPVSIAYKQVHENPEPLNRLVADVPKGFEAIVAKLLAKRPEVRYQSADEVRDELRRFRNGEPVQALVTVMGGDAAADGTEVTDVGDGAGSPLSDEIRAANALGDAGQHEEAIERLQHLLAKQTLENGPDHPDTLMTRYWIAYWDGEAGNPEQAVHTLQLLLTDETRILGPDHPDTLMTRYWIAYWDGEAGNPEQAVHTLQLLLPDQTRIGGPDHPDTLGLRFSIAYWLASASVRGEAIRELKRLLTDQTRILGADHPDTLATRRWIARLLFDLGQSDTAIQRKQELLEDLTRLCGSEHADTLEECDGLVRMLVAAERYDEAIGQLQKLLWARTSTLGEADTATFATRHELARISALAGQLDRAIAGLRGLVADQERHLESDDPHLLDTKTLLADLLNGQH